LASRSATEPPSTFDGLPCFYEFVFGGFGLNVPPEQFGINGFDARANVIDELDDSLH
jgi:hypothetical protein